MEKKRKHGGSRPGAGRPKTKPPTTTLSWRVPVTLAPVLKIKIDALIKKALRVNIDSGQ
jgi:hypothetical protein